MQSIHYSGALNFIYNPLTSQAILPTFSMYIDLLDRLREIYDIIHCQVELFLKKNIATIKAHFLWRRRRQHWMWICMHLIEALENLLHIWFKKKILWFDFIFVVNSMSNAGRRTLLRRTWWKFRKSFPFNDDAKMMMVTVVI